MPAPYSTDLRQRVLAACAAHEASRAEVARRYRIGASTLYRWLQAEREEGRTAAKPHAGGPVSQFDAALLRQLYGEQPDATLGEVATRYEAQTHVPISVSSIERFVQVLDLRRKKKVPARRGAGPPRRGGRARHVP
jgi:transposase